MKYIYTISLLTLTLLAFGQSFILNQKDSLGKKHGKWLIYLDKDWKRVDDSTKALYSRYTFFDHGINIYPMGPCGGKGYKLIPFAERHKIIVLDGEYTWYDSNGKLSSVHTFKNGEYVSCKEYFASGELNQLFDYTTKCEGQLHGWKVTIYDKKGSVTHSSITCKDKNGNWPKMRD